MNITDIENNGTHHINSVVNFLNSKKKTIEANADNAMEVTDKQIQKLAPI